MDTTEIAAAEITVVWHVEATDVALRALNRFASARGLALRAPSTAHWVAAMPIDTSRGDAVDRGINAAQNALAGSDATLAVAHLAAAEALLLAHPELPHAAWLWAELKRTWALHYEQLSPPRADLAAQARREAIALAGPRARGTAEPELQPTPTRVLRASYPPGHTLWVDSHESASASGTDLQVNAGPHHLVLRNPAGSVAWSGFVHILVDTDLRLPVGAAQSACSEAEFQAVTWDGRAVPRAGNIQCPSWLIALPTATGVRLHTCHQGTCASTIEWSGLPSAPFVLNTPAPKATPWPNWATWTLIAAGALGATATTLVAAGVFTDRPQDTRFVAGGLEIR